MAQIAGIASFTNDGYRNLSCPLCGGFLKVKIYASPINDERKYKCTRCKSRLSLEIIETDEVNELGSVKINLSVTSAVKSNILMRLKKN